MESLRREREEHAARLRREREEHAAEVTLYMEEIAELNRALAESRRESSRGRR
jgi:hypothetical protein